MSDDSTQNTSPSSDYPNLKPWPKGVSGNPGGRPKKPMLDEALAELLEDPNTAKAVALALLEKARKGDTKTAQLVAERTQGKPKQAITVDGSLSNLPTTEPEIHERIRQLRSELARIGSTGEPDSVRAAASENQEPPQDESVLP